MHRVKANVGDKLMVAYDVIPYRETAKFGWLSDNKKIATVNENGVITAHESGTAYVSILSSTGEIKDTVMVVVGDGLNGKVYEDTIQDYLEYSNGISQARCL